VEIVLPVIADAEGDLEIGTDTDFILDESADDFFPEDDMAVADLLHEREGTTEQIVLQRGERVGAAEVGIVVESAAADVGHLDTAP